MQYTALSYCWGPGAVDQLSLLRTTTETVAEFAKELPAEQLPATLADAIKITRALAIPYIWIDELCIVQDDDRDWQREAAAMDRVYSGSQLTIAASESPHSSMGCFSPYQCGPRDRVTTFHVLDSAQTVRFYYNDIRDYPRRGALSIARGLCKSNSLTTRALLHAPGNALAVSRKTHGGERLVLWGCIRN